MKKIIFTIVMGIGLVSSYAQLKVVSNGDILLSNTTIGTTTANLDNSSE